MKRILSTVVAVWMSVALVACTSDGGVSPDLVNAVLSAGAQAAGVSGTDGDRTAMGLREALEVATGRAVDETSKAGGFSANDLIRVRLPEQLDTPVKVLRGIGFGSQIDQLENTMNLAAESAAAEATPIFVNAIKQLTFADAQQILSGGDTAATDFFRGKTETSLIERFEPVVDGAMQNVGLYKDYESLLGQYEALPFSDKPNLNLTDHVTDQTMNGLFSVLATEEKRIREDPVARTTELLREVFGR